MPYSQPWLGNSEDLRREASWSQSLLCPRTVGETDLGSAQAPSASALCADPKREYDLSHICPENVSCLNDIVEQADCHIVISSTWRIGHTKDEIASLLAEKGFKFPERIIDMTDTGPGIRGTQIQRWLLAHWDDIDGVCIIDDDSDMDPYMPWLVKTHFFAGGIKQKHVQFAVNLLLEKFEPQNKPQIPRNKVNYKTNDPDPCRARVPSASGLCPDPNDFRGTIAELLCSPELGQPQLTDAERSWLEDLIADHNDRHLLAGEKKKLSDLCARTKI